MSVMRLTSFRQMVGAVALLLLCLSLPVFAARDLGTDHLSPEGDELIVFETADCIYCALFRRDVLPKYQRSMRARSVPIRFLDASRAQVMGQRLSRNLTTVPTFVLMRRGREVSRISGYTGPGAFFQLVGRMFRHMPEEPR